MNKKTGRTVFTVLLLVGLSCSVSRRNQDREIAAVLAQSAGYWNDKGTAALDSARFDQAEICFRQALTITPTDPVLHNNLGVSFFHQQRMDSAIAAYQTAVRLRPGYVMAFRNLANVYVVSKEWNLALKAVDEWIRMEPADAESRSLKGLVLEELDRFDEAIQSVQAAISLKPDQGSYYNNLGALLFRQGKLDQAIAGFQTALRLQPGSGETMFNLANTFARQCRLEESLEYYRQALVQRPDLIGAANNYALALTALHRLPEAVALLRAASSRRSDADMVLYNLSSVLLRMDSTEAALACIERVVLLKPDRAPYYLQWGNVLSRLGRHREALTAYGRAIALDSTLALGYNQLANAYVEGHTPLAAIHAYKKAIELYPEYLDSRYFRVGRESDLGFFDLLAGCDDAWEISADYASIFIGLAKTYVAVGQITGAETAFKRAIEIQPELPDAYENLALLYQQQKKQKLFREMLASGRVQRSRFALKADSISAALTYAEQALAIQPDNTDALAIMAAVDIRRQNWSRAEQEIKKGLSVLPSSISLLMAYAEYLNARGKFDQAIYYLVKVITMKPNFTPAIKELAANLAVVGKSAEANRYKAELAFILGSEMEAAGQWDRALLEFRRAYDLEKELRYLSAQGIILARKHLNQDAKDIFYTVLQQDSLQWTALYGLGIVLGDQGNYVQAIPYLEKAVKQNPLMGRAHFSLAINYHFAQQPHLAKAHLHRALELGVQIKPELLLQYQIEP